MFTEEQKAALDASLNRRAVLTRRERGTELSYVEGWWVKAKLNKIFGPDGWSCRVCSLDIETWEGKDKNGKPRREAEAVAVVCLGFPGVDHEDTGSGNGYGATAKGDAAKEAVTDALKRAAVHLGWATGLALYDKAQRNVTNG